jgi:hypothetical protein
VRHADDGHDRSALLRFALGPVGEDVLHMRARASMPSKACLSEASGAYNRPLTRRFARPSENKRSMKLPISLARVIPFDHVASEMRQGDVGPS